MSAGERAGGWAGRSEPILDAFDDRSIDNAVDDVNRQGSAVGDSSFAVIRAAQPERGQRVACPQMDNKLMYAPKVGQGRSSSTDGLSPFQNEAPGSGTGRSRPTSDQGR